MLFIFWVILKISFTQVYNLFSVQVLTLLQWYLYRGQYHQDVTDRQENVKKKEKKKIG